jgi:galactokinase
MTKTTERRIDQVAAIFRTRFGSEPQWIIRAPGRVNLIGEHTDYNEGYVLPTAIDRDMLIAASRRETEDKTVRVYATEYDQEDAFSLDHIVQHESLAWANYLRGVVRIYRDAGHSMPSFDAVLCSNIPQGAGLSSSAAFEVAVGTLLKEMSNLEISLKETALLAQRAENDFVGVKCGIMDQFVSALGEPDSALMVDCRSLDCKVVPLNISDNQVSIVVTNSGVRRGLVDSEYNDRRQSCLQGAAELAKLLQRDDVQSLRDIEMAEFISVEAHLPLVLAKRCHHVISENLRVLLAVTALENENFEDFGRLMNTSHASLRDHFQVSCPEIDILVNDAQHHQGVLGSRITGAGFGGCTVSLIREESIESYRNEVVPRYERKTGCQAEVYICTPAAGASVLKRP